ncbi:MAG: NAD regulator [Hyphomicrobiaceae bacterium]|nr:NAD regulator [Hyphomicrobiaceae bacterium]
MNSPMRHVESTRAASSQPATGALPTPAQEAVALNLCAVALAIRGNDPVVAVTNGPRPRVASLPSGAYVPSEHPNLKEGLAAAIARAADLHITNSQPLCTFGEGMFVQPVEAAQTEPQLPVVSLCYLSLVQPDLAQDGARLNWLSWYDIFPWEDFRNGKPQVLGAIEAQLADWAREDDEAPTGGLDRASRIRIAFGADSSGWDEEKIVERYDLMCEAGLAGERAQSQTGITLWHPRLGFHARVLACAIAELRRSIKSRPAIFNLMPELFTLFELQKAVEGILGPHLHKQNFRRLVEGEGLVEPTAEFRQRTGGRPARLYRFRPSVLLERAAPGVRLKPGRAAA